MRHTQIVFSKYIVFLHNTYIHTYIHSITYIHTLFTYIHYIRILPIHNIIIYPYNSANTYIHTYYIWTQTQVHIDIYILPLHTVWIAHPTYNNTYFGFTCRGSRFYRCCCVAYTHTGASIHTLYNIINKYIYIYIYIHTNNIHTNTHIQIHTYIHTYIHYIRILPIHNIIIYPYIFCQYIQI